MKRVASILAATGCALLVSVAPIDAFDRGTVSIQSGENGEVVLRVSGIGRPPARSPNSAQAEAAARNAAEIDAYSRVAYLLGRVERSQGPERIVSSFHGRFQGIHVEKSERLADGTVRAEVVISVPAKQVPELLERIDEYIGELEAARRSAPRPR